MLFLILWLLKICPLGNAMIVWTQFETQYEENYLFLLKVFHFNFQKKVLLIKGVNLGIWSHSDFKNFPTNQNHFVVFSGKTLAITKFYNLIKFKYNLSFLVNMWLDGLISQLFQKSPDSKTLKSHYISHSI